MRPLLDIDPGGHSHFEVPVDGDKLQLRARREAQFLTERLGDDKPSCLVDGGTHTIKIPLKYH